MKYILLVLAFSIQPLLHTPAQNYAAPDSRWIGGFEENKTLRGYANYSIFFGASGPIVDTLELDLKFESTVASWCAPDGQLLLLSNGCVITDGAGRVLENGEGINPGEMHDWTCGKVGYISPRGAMFLPAPGQPGVFYLLHMGARYDPVRKIRYGPFYYSIVDLNANGGKGTVLQKNVMIQGDDMEPFSVVKHGNGRDWWIVAPIFGTKSLDTWLLSPKGIHNAPIQLLGTVMSGQRVGSTCFSLDGTRFVRYHCDFGASVYHFDRCSGKFSESRFIKTPLPLLFGGGTAFSQDNRFVYFTSQSALYRADMLDAQPRMDTVFHVFDNWDWGTTLHHMQYGPDGRLYVGTVSRADYINAINFPNNGTLPSLTFKAVSLKVHNERGLPHFPNFMLFDLPNAPCDSLGISSTQNLYKDGQSPDLRVSPNPVDGVARVQFALPHGQCERFVVLDALGKELYNWQKNEKFGTFDMDTSHWKSGVYFLIMLHADGSRTGLRFVVK